ncbi:hypothetical protein IDSA_07990 [Pseudidiomarina salinarum]|uniref:YdbS-like PH domain-containing protein n=1 Tax=Pseudidiomarina salinarum TaxID=435908 RepID=A0A094IV58_9GAMM|nr:PH domain-containing protein [Pseudidiomarina salinarum]KFZ31002.1 hypothetical protein IDSA_07990 [Pseudidiomarina salinarum]RUO71486.1 hypothetical protein CWI79_08685 [Pseudidiomarina salinarum]
MSELNWQRTPPITMVFFILREIKRLVSNVTNLIPVLAVVAVSGTPAKAGILVALAFFLFTIAVAVMHYNRFLFAIADDAIHLRTGIMNRQNLTLKFDRIQQAELNETWYFRPFGLTILSVDSAGAGGSEVEIPGLKTELAQQLRQQVLATEKTDDKKSGEAADSGSQEQSEPDYQRQFSLPDIIRAGIIDNKIFVLLAVLAYPLSQLDIMEDYIVPWLETNTQWLDTDNWWVAPLLGIAVLAVLFVLAIGVSIVRYYGLSLTIDGGRYQARGGLFTIRTLSFRYHKLQRVQIRQNLRARLLGRWTLRVSQLRPRQQAQGQSASQFTLPVVTAPVLADLRKLLKLPAPESLGWQRISVLALLGPSIWLAVLAPLGAYLIYRQVDSLMLAAIVSAGLWLLLQIYIVLRWMRFSYSTGEDWLAVRRGVLSRRENWYPLYKVQQIDVKRSPWLRVLGFADLILNTPAGSEDIRYLTRSQAEQLQRQWVNDIARSHKPWM